MKNIRLKESELERLYVIKKVIDGDISQVEAAETLKLSARQIRRLVKRIKTEGNEGVKGRQKGSNRSFKNEFKANVLALVRSQYADFTPTFASEKLNELNNVKINRETLRQWMIKDGLKKEKSRKVARIHQSRTRRPRFGELIQIDGSHHDWFEGRALKCCLYVFIDDATSQIVSMRFEQSETSMRYFRCLEPYLKTHGRPIALYSDRHSIFKTTRQECVDGRLSDTQFHSSLRNLDIELICARSSQAKGRVERANQTLQDRLIKEMRLAKINTMEEGNAYLSEFIIKYNQKFAIEPIQSEDAHRPLYQDAAKLRQILSQQSTRKLSKNLEISHNRLIYQI
ncbi:MAG: ISNCY family transposase, partial [Alphaproteobacteria bacterium]|nr:ISNCY family transposase [Alphaproteobacteria bacterium]